jgi:hypothetical protein
MCQHSNSGPVRPTTSNKDAPRSYSVNIVWRYVAPLKPTPSFGLKPHNSQTRVRARNSEDISSASALHEAKSTKAVIRVGGSRCSAPRCTHAATKFTAPGRTSLLRAKTACHWRFEAHTVWNLPQDPGPFRYRSPSLQRVPCRLCVEW